MRRALVVCALAAVAALAVWRVAESRAKHPQVASVTAPPPAQRPAAVVDAAAVRQDATPVALPVERTFEQYVERLVELGVRTWEALEAEARETADALDAATREELAELRREIEASEEKALHALCGLLSEDPTLPGKVRRRALLTILELGLRARWQRAEYGASRTSCDRLVAAILASLEQDEVLARELGSELLADEPFLGAAHEIAVLDLVERSAAEPFLAEVAEALLRTLWRNLEREGARSTAELASLALLFADDTNPTRRLAALHHLLTADDGRYADWVVDLVVRQGEEEIAGELAMTAAAELQPERALRVLEKISALDAVQTTGAFLMLGQRAPGTMRAAYEQKIADGIAAHVRAELVTGAGFRGDAVDLAQLAFDQDPDPEVRTRALFVLAAQAAPEIAERTLREALEDPRFANRPERIGAVVSALGNLAQTGAVNAVDRIGRRALGHPMLTDGDRARLEQLLARYTPR